MNKKSLDWSDTIPLFIIGFLIALIICLVKGDWWCIEHDTSSTCVNWVYEGGK